MHHIFTSHINWPVALYDIGKGAVDILLWFWMISGAVFGLRFLAYFLLDKDSGHRSLAAAHTLIPFPINHRRNRED